MLCPSCEVDTCHREGQHPEMANLYTEIGRLPPATFPLLLRVNGGESAGGLWQVQAFFHPEGRVDGFPTNYIGAFGITADELPSAVVMALGLASTYGYAVSWVSLPGEPLGQQYPSLAAMAQAPRPEMAVQGTNIMQPQPARPEAMRAFLARIQALADQVAPPPAPEAPAPAPEPEPLTAAVAPSPAVPAPAPVIAVVPAPAPVSVSETDKPVKTQAKRKAPAKKKAPARQKTAKK